MASALQLPNPSVRILCKSNTRTWRDLRDVETQSSVKAQRVAENIGNIDIEPLCTNRPPLIIDIHLRSSHTAIAATRQPQLTFLHIQGSKSNVWKILSSLCYQPFSKGGLHDSHVRVDMQVPLVQISVQQNLQTFHQGWGGGSPGRAGVLGMCPGTHKHLQVHAWQEGGVVHVSLKGEG